jgi:cholesterol oxidase
MGNTRREFGRNILAAASLLGLRTIGVRSVLSSGLLAACSSESDPRSARDASAGPAWLDASEGSTLPPATPDASSELPRDAGFDDAGSDATSARGKPRVIVVGSGYGSAVTALRLTERGIPVTMIEMGRLWNAPGPDGKIFCKPFSPDGRAMWFRDKVTAVFKRLAGFPIEIPVPVQAGILALRGNDDMEVYCGRGVGGGSLVNMSIYVQPRREVLKRAIPELDADEMLATYYPRALSMLRASQVPIDIATNAAGYQYSRVGAEHARAAGIDVELCTSGYDYAYMAQEIADQVPKSATDGEAGFGNNYGKRSLDKTYIADAMGTGLLTILSLTQVTKITRARDGDYVVSCREIDIDGKVLSERELSCSHLFLGGGSMGTSELLVRARESGALPDLNQHVGTAWGPNSDIFVARDCPLNQPTGTVQFGVPSMAFHTRDQDDKMLFSMIIPFPVGIETYFAMNIVMTENPEAGSFVYDKAADRVDLKWDVSQNEPAVRSTRFVFDKLNQASGTDYNPDIFDGPLLGDRATYHPVGGCPLGRATDLYGRIPNYPGLYVIDGSLIPVGVGANPALTVTALAERNLERILAEDHRTA